MFKTFAAASILVSAALAQSATNIPDGISDGCKSFLTSLNSDTNLSTCLSALSSATNSTSGAPTPSSLATLCSDSVGSQCDSALRTASAKFWQSCQSDMMSNSDVLRDYEVLYTLAPFRTALCSKDDAGNFCVIQSKNWAPSGAKDSQNVLALPGQIPNADTFSSSNIPFLFLHNSTDSSSLCTTCTRNILTSYINYESNTPFGPGLAKSILLKGQTDLYKSVTDTCGQNFMSGAVQAAGGLSGGTLHSGAEQVSSAAQRVLAAGMGVVALGFSALF